MSELEIRERKQFKALAHPLRGRILSELTKNHPATPSQVARALGVAASKVHYHMRILEEAGLVRLEETRQVGSITELYFVPAADHFVVRAPANDPAFQSELLQEVASQWQQLLADLEQLAPGGRKAAERHRLFLRILLLDANEEGVADVEEAARKLQETFAAAVRDWPGRRYRLVTALVPVAEESDSPAAPPAAGSPNPRKDD